MTVERILGRSFRLLVAHPGLMLGLAAIAVLPGLVLAEVEHRLPGWVGLDGAPLLLGSGWAFALLPLVGARFVLDAIVTGALALAVSEIHLGRETSPRAVLGRAWGRLPSLLLASLFAAAAILAGTCLFLVPGLVWGLSLAVFAPVLMVEGRRARESLRRSWELMDGSRLKALAVFAVLLVAAAVPQLVLWSSFGWEVPGGIGRVVEAGVALVYTPVCAVATVLIYYDARARKESFDLDTLAQLMVFDR